MSVIFEELPLSEICAQLGANEKLLYEYREKLEEWLLMQPHLPQIVCNRRLVNAILASKFSLEGAKQKLDSYYTVKSILPDIFQDRNPFCDRIRISQDNVTLVILPKLTPEGHNVSIIDIVTKDASNFDYHDITKYNMMICEVRSLIYQYNMGDIILVDCKNISLGHIARSSPTAVKKSIVAIVNGLGARIKGIYFINASPFIDRILALLKPCLKPKLQQRLRVYQTGEMNSLFESIPKNIMPKDYGGDEYPMSKLKDFWREKVEENHDWFIEQEKALIEESLRPGEPVNGNDLFGFSGSFRKLDID